MPNCQDESAACKQDRKNYEDARAAREESEKRIYRWAGDVQKAGRDLVASGGTAAAGVAVAWGAGWTGVGLLLGGIMFVGGTVAAGVSYQKQSSAKANLANERANCELFRQKMEDARKNALADCKDSDCVPAPAQPCP